MKTMLSPKELGEAIGVSESSLKRWADSGQLRVARTAGGHRRIELAEAIRFIRAAGFPLRNPALLGIPDQAADAAGDTSPDTFHQALLAGDVAAAEGMLLGEYLRGGRVADMMDTTLAPAMRAIGHLWQHSDDRGIFVEHRATDICMRILQRIRGLIPGENAAPVAVGCAPLDDLHALPSLMAATVLADEGWTAVNLAALTPPAALACAAEESQARLVWLALSAGRDDAPRTALNAVRAALDASGCGAPLIVGGPAAHALRQSATGAAHVATSMTELAAVARDYRNREFGAI
jgi:MerR family transcriptional regulator, light-induced transcriptional regulator